MRKLSSDDCVKTRKYWFALQLVLLLEAVLAFYLVWIVARGALAVAGQPFFDLVLLLVMAILGLVWVLVALMGAVKRRSWSRALTITLQVSVCALAIGLFQGIAGQQTGTAWFLVTLASIATVCAIMACPAPPTETTIES